MVYYTHHTEMLVSHYECVYVFSDYSDLCMIYYTHHRNMDATQHVRVHLQGLYSGKKEDK